MNYYDVPYGESEKQKADIYVNDKCPDTIVYIHGCGLTGGDKGGNRFLDYLINEGYSVVSVNYRLYPEAKYPDYIECKTERKKIRIRRKNIGNRQFRRGVYTFHVTV